MTNPTGPAVTFAGDHYGMYVVRVEPYRTSDRNGDPVQVSEFYVNGMLDTCEGQRIKKNGEPYAARQCLAVSPPPNVQALLDKARAERSL